TDPTTGLCILEESVGKLQYLHAQGRFCKDLKYSEIIKSIKSYLPKTEVISIDGPLTLGKGKGLLRLYEKFLTTQTFRDEKVAPLPPAFLPELSTGGRELVGKLKKFNFVLNKNLIETFVSLVNKVCPDNFLLQFLGDRNFQTEFTFPCQVSKHQKSALICALVAFLHSAQKTSYLGYKDGLLFLPKISFWKPEWQEKFYQEWQKRDRLRYHLLETSLFSN
ncbi:MAG: hypothetical protein PHF44_02155, partial [Candidatus Pacebacteria bacterium]|nr:hypothetical protein [Candidatus Paceibacterota bacterium]